jgi:hypothetical protein
MSLKCGNCCHYFEVEYKKNGKVYTSCEKCREYKRNWMKDHKDYEKNYMKKWKADDFEARIPMTKEEYLLKQKEAKKKYQKLHWEEIWLRNKEFRETHEKQTKAYQQQYRMMKKGLIDKVNVSFKKDENPKEPEKPKDDIYNDFKNDNDINEDDFIDFINKCVKI